MRLGRSANAFASAVRIRYNPGPVLVGEIMQNPVLILGMHRSGTSPLARVLNLLGVDLGAHCIPANEFNAKGYWEHEILCALNEKLLTACQSSWFDCLPFASECLDSEALRGVCKQIKTVLTHDFSKVKLWGVKDPRLCRLLPVWKPVLESLKVHPRCVIITRNPLEIARSLQKRDHMSLTHSYYLTLRYWLELEKNTRGLPRLFLSYQALMTNPVDCVERLCAFLSIEKTPTLMQELQTFIDADLRHNASSDVEFFQSATVPEPLKEIYKIFQAASENNADSLSPEVHFDLTPERMATLLTAYHETMQGFYSNGTGADKYLIAEMQASLSWKITAPLRRLKRFYLFRSLREA